MHPGMPDRWGGSFVGFLIVLILLCLLFLLSSREVIAQTLPPPDFAGFGWGVGLQWTNSLTEDLVTREAVSLVGPDRIVEVSKLSNTHYSMIFESHVTFQWRPAVAVGPYFSVTPGQDELIQAVGLGLLFELNRPRLNPQTGRTEPSPVSFNLGVGVNVFLHVTMLKDGVVPGFPLPSTITDPIIEREKAALQVMSVVGF